MKDFATKLKAARKRAKLTQVEAARRAGIGQPHWADYERGKQTPNIATAARLAEAVKTTLRALV